MSDTIDWLPNPRRAPRQDTLSQPEGTTRDILGDVWILIPEATVAQRAERGLRETQSQLESELAAAQHLHKISTQLIHARDVGSLYDAILDAEVAIIRSDFASMQTFYPERGEFRLLAYRGFIPTAAAFWEWVRPGSGSTCGCALATGERSIVPDIELSDFMAGSEDLETYRQTGIRAVQSTPLV